MTTKVLDGTDGAVSAAFGALAGIPLSGVVMPRHAPHPNSTTTFSRAAGMVFATGVTAGPHLGNVTSFGGVSKAFGTTATLFFGMVAKPGYGATSQASRHPSNVGTSPFGTASGLDVTSEAPNGTARLPPLQELQAGFSPRVQCLTRPTKFIIKINSCYNSNI
jgi:hypothetical protein